jgi:acyl-CoA oxidase
MAEELKKERERSKLNLEELTNFLDGGKIHTEKRRKIIKIVVDNPVFHEVDELHDEPLDVALKKSAKFIQIARTIQDIDERWDFIKSFDYHRGVLPFIPAIKVQGTDEQKAKWLKLALDYDIIGAYAQTELGHGTFVRGMETTAEFDPSTQEFILNSPTLTSIKWWSALLGCVATHAIVIARLITKGHDHGMHLFIVQIRSLEDHHPLPGIKVGDIGPKFGLNFYDNGFLHLTNVRIPRDHMLMKHSQVLPDGTYFKPPTDKVTYGSLVYGRVMLFDTSAKLLAQAVTIAIRYSVVRRQTINRPGCVGIKLV